MITSTYNTRPLIPDSNRFIRSDAVTDITEKEKQWLIDQRITTVFDLRTDRERHEKPSPLATDSRFSYTCTPVRHGSTVPATPDDVSASYIAMIDDEFMQIIDRITNASSNVLFFCNAGKDRSGVVSAVLLHSLGYDRAYIVEDYMKSAECLRSVLEQYLQEHPDVDRNVITPHPGYMERFLDWFEGVYDDRV
ncbi:MAG: tyrosine-protein phosphatase [Lachnospiraceae bacterium]|nr:tyrosine-protein phosphatase [Lachnospiraceae bacterium]